MRCVTVLLTGGTIAGVREASGTVHVGASIAGLPLEEIAQQAGIKIELREIFNKLSEDFEPTDWTVLAKAVAEEIKRDEIDGVVILHGTFTMSYTAAALAFLLPNLSKPVVLTGGQKPFHELSDHATRHLRDSLHVAAYGDIAEVLVLFSAKGGGSQTNVYRGVRVQKHSARGLDAFEGNYSESLMQVNDGNLVVNTKEYRPRGGDFTLPVITEFERRVLCLRAFPGFDSSWIVRLLDDGIHGIIVQGYSDGAVSTANDTILRAMKRAKEAGAFVGFTSQAWGAVTLLDYSSGVTVRRAGGIPLGDMNVDTAVVKLMWCLGRHPYDREAVEREMLFPFCRELTIGSENRFPSSQ